MDSYTGEEKALVEKRFSDSTGGIYRAHQPIYGYMKGPCEWYFTGRYIPTLRIMKELARIRCESMLDVGGAEGYKSYIARSLYGLRVQTSDLSEEACERAEEIFGVKGKALDIHDLAFADGEFDVLTCSETLEHITEPKQAIEELLRVAKKAVIITVPVEDPEHLEEHYSKNNHINAFDVDSFDYLRERGLTVMSKKYLDKRILYYGMLLENAMRLDYNKDRKYPRFAYSLFNFGIRVFNGRRGEWIMARLVAADERASRSAKDYAGVLCVILKDPTCYGRPRRRVTSRQIMRFTVPHYYLKAKA
jgi:ubiquinone/menaquinone biosynthesis C-methylase UbiE